MPLDPVNDLQQAIGHGGEQAFNLVPTILKRVLRDELWRGRARQDGKPFKSFEEFASYKLWWGLETPVDDLRVFCRRQPDVVEDIDRALTPMESHGGAREIKQGDSVPLKRERGNSAIYRRKRLKRESEELFEAVVAGRMTLIAAEQKAGLRRDPTSLDLLRKIWRKATSDERRTFLAEVRK